jgi:hypothetical protein
LNLKSPCPIILFPISKELNEDIVKKEEAKRPFLIKDRRELREFIK